MLCPNCQTKLEDVRNAETWVVVGLLCPNCRYYQHLFKEGKHESINAEAATSARFESFTKE